MTIGQVALAAALVALVALAVMLAADRLRRRVKADDPTDRAGA